MILLPAIDLYEGKVVRLTRGDYGNMTVYRDDPAAQAAEFQAAGPPGSIRWTWRGPGTEAPPILR